MLLHVNSQTLQHNSPKRWCQKEAWKETISVPQSIFFLFSSLVLWVTVHVSISTTFPSANVKVKLRWFTDFFRFHLFVFTRFSDETWIFFLFSSFLYCFKTRKEGRFAENCFLFSFVFAYNSVRAFKWRDIYWIIVELVRCLSSARLFNFFFLNSPLYRFLVFPPEISTLEWTLSE